MGYPSLFPVPTKQCPQHPRKHVSKNRRNLIWPFLIEEITLNQDCGTEPRWQLKLRKTSGRRGQDVWQLRQNLAYVWRRTTEAVDISSKHAMTGSDQLPSARLMSDKYQAKSPSLLNTSLQHLSRFLINPFKLSAARVSSCFKYFYETYFITSFPIPIGPHSVAKMQFFTIIFTIFAVSALAQKKTAG